MSVEQNKALRQQWTETISARKLDEAFALLSPDFVSHTARGALGIEGIRAYFEMVFTAFPDQRVTSIQMIAEGDKVVDHMRVEATHTGPFMGIPPTGKRMSWTFIDIVRYANGKMVEHWNESDQLGMMQQMGLVPAMPQG
jgi:predicted ester cyclase